MTIDEILRKVCGFGVKLVEINLNFPQDLTILDLRSWVVSQLNKQGEPLRWAITSIQLPIANDLDRQVKVEAILIIH